MRADKSKHLLLISGIVVALVAGALHSLPADTSGAALAEGRGLSEVNVLLRVHTDHEGGHVDHLLADADVTLEDEHTSVVDRAGNAELEHTGLKTTLHKLGEGQTEDVIELLLLLAEEAETTESSHEGSACNRKEMKHIHGKNAA